MLMILMIQLLVAPVYFQRKYETINIKTINMKTINMKTKNEYLMSIFHMCQYTMPFPEGGWGVGG